jgi:hypothetical protein
MENIRIPEVWQHGVLAGGKLLQTSVFSVCEYWTINGEALREIQAASVEK